MLSQATRHNAQWGDAFTEHGDIGKIFVVKKYLVTPSVFKLQKWFLHQNGVEFNQKSKSDQVVAASWTLVGSPKHAEKMLIQLISAIGPSWPAVHC